MRIEHPYTNMTGGKWLRGNLHTHTTASDGGHPIQEVINAYADRGYGFLMISDHDVYTSPDDYAKLDSKGLLLIPGNEISRGGPHLLHVDANCRIEPFAPRQKVINDANAAGGFVIVNHPNWGETFNHCPMERMAEWIDYVGLEIYNGVIGRLAGSPYATDRWDMLLAAGRRVWGFANDDMHRMEAGDFALGWNIAYVTDPTPAGVVEALRSGRFYASTGVTISNIAVQGATIHVETDNARRIVALHKSGRRLAISDSNTIQVEAPQDTPYVRFECWGDGERFAWTQPFFVVAD